ncbi:hypothetical protein GOBAR_DD00788 [Gossypium barbadense]|nr:hypothetical protein GOBAR_DD00788 [Gossypium barbadense]
MSLKSIMRELKELKDGIGNMSKRGDQSKLWRSRTRSHVAPDEAPLESQLSEQSPWANLPPELLLDIIQRVEESETAWPARAVVVFCAAVCRSWREITKEIVKTPEQCGRLTFPISLKQPGPRESPIQCYIRRDRTSSTYLLFYGLVPSEGESDKLLLAARKVRRATCTDFVISLVADDFSRASNTYVGKLRSNFLGTKFTVYDSQPPCGSMIQSTARLSRRFHSKQLLMSSMFSGHEDQGECIASCTQFLYLLFKKVALLQHHQLFPQSLDEQLSPLHSSKGKEPIVDTISPSIRATPVFSPGSREPLALKNKAPRWHEQLQCWCLNFKGRVTVASVKNFQLVAAVEPSHNVSPEEQEKLVNNHHRLGICIIDVAIDPSFNAIAIYKVALRELAYGCQYLGRR